MSTKILIIDDEKDICLTLSKVLESKGYKTSYSLDSKSAMSEIKRSVVDLVLLDVWLEGSKLQGIDLLKVIKEYNPNIPVILISGHGNIELAVNAIKKGAFYFVEKPFKSEKLFLLIERALENAFFKKEYEILKSLLDDSSKIIGNSSSIKNIKKIMNRISTSNARIFINGETGSGKQLLAKHIHSNSSRSKKPFMVLNCAMINNTNFLKTFFGENTGSDQSIGLVKKAEGGTIFLKEIADMPYEVQGQFTNFLQKETYSIGGENEKYSSNIRFISSTSKNPLEEIENNNLRKDLFYRLNVTNIKIPPINKRREDIPLLIDYFIEKITTKKQLKKIKLTKEAYAVLQTFDWPGNITQIRNFIDWLYIMYPEMIKSDKQIGTNLLPKELFSKKVDEKTTDENDIVMNLPIKEARTEFEKKYLINQVNRFGGNISKTANFIGMERSALHRKIKNIGVKK